MLLRFGVANHLSIRDKQELSLIALSSIKDDEKTLIETAATKSHRVLPAAIIYGANGSGKSNLTDALSWMSGAVLNSQRSGDPEKEVPRKPFKLDPDYLSKPSLFDIDFVTNGIRYHYGFEASDNAFINEWLYAYPNHVRQVLFERDRKSFHFGRNLKGHNRTIADLTRDNSLFLSAAYQNDHKDLMPVARYFLSLFCHDEISIPGIGASQKLANDEIDRRVIKFLDEIGTGVVDYRKDEIAIPEKMRKFHKELSTAIHNMSGQDIGIDLKNDKEIKIELAHRGSDGRKVFFDLDRESAGTRRLLMLLGPAFRALSTGRPLVVDELDASLHTEACSAFVELFCTPRTNPKGAQLIATTHDTNLLHSQLLRRDQTWFIEKSESGDSRLFPLTDIRTRRGDNIEKGYLQGRYGGIVFPRPVDEFAGFG